MKTQKMLHAKRRLREFLVPKRQRETLFSDRSGARFVKRAYALRFIGLAIGYVCVGAVLWFQHASMSIEVSVALYCLAWPHIGYLKARRSDRAGHSEFGNMIIDSFVGGMIVVAMQFALLPAMLVVLMFTMNNVAAGGWRLLLRGGFACIAGLLMGIAIFGFVIHLQSSYIITITSLPLLVVYPLSLAFMSHATALKLAQRSKELKHLSEHDPLTGLPNRLTFTRHLLEQVEHARLMKCRVSVMFIDLDDFKRVNDTYGHRTGDELLIYVAAQLMTYAGTTEKVARYGGDEFAILSTQSTIGAVEKIAAALISLARQPIFVAGVELHAHMSVGISTWPEHGEDSQALMNGADAAMYAAKNSGRNRIVTFDPNHFT